MNRSDYFNYIEEKLNILSYRIKCRGQINLLDLNIYSETFFADLLSLLLKYNLKNINQIKQNTEGIDLIDESKKIIAQVSSTCTKQKIEKSLDKKIFDSYPGFRFKFIAIAGDADKLRNDTYKNPHKVLFSPANDIYDIKSLLNIVLNQDIIRQRNTYDFIRRELGNNIDIVKMDSNLTSIINILSQEKLSDIVESPEINPFEVQRKIEFNDLKSVQSTIDDYKVFYSKLDEKYKEFDKLGTNKSMSVLSVIRSKYTRLIGKISDSQQIFFTIIDDLIELIKSSKNYIDIPYEELEVCVSILVVDAFIRCKIFKNPEGYNYVITR